MLFEPKEPSAAGASQKLGLALYIATHILDPRRENIPGAVAVTAG